MWRLAEKFSASKRVSSLIPGPVLRRALQELRRSRLAWAVAALAVSVIFSAEAARAQDATWLASPGTAEWTTGSNWSTASVPTNTATFGASNTTHLTISNSTSINEILFGAGAPFYLITIGGAAPVLSINGAGIVNNSSSVPQFTVNANGEIDFNNSSTAGNALILSNGTIKFNNSSTAGNATILGNSSGRNFIYFNGNSTAGNAAIVPGSGNVVAFTGNSTAGNAQIFAEGGVVDFSLSTGPLGNKMLSAGSIEDFGAGTFYLGANQLTVGSNNLSTSVGGVISDCGPGGTSCLNAYATGGSLIKVGSGTLTLSGINTYTGPTTVNGGTLEVDGSIASSSLTTADSGATLAGIGIVGTANIASGGILAPGSNGIGTLTVQGNLAIANGAIYQIAVSPTAASLVNVMGTANLSGGTVQVLAQNGTYAPSHTYTILTATDGVTGTFAGVTNDLALLLASGLTYDANDVYLTLHAIANFCGAAVTRNQCATAQAIQAGGPGNPIYNAVVSQTAAGVQQAFNSLSGEINADVRGQILDASRFGRQMMLMRLYEAEAADLPGGMSTAHGGALTYFRYAQEDESPNPLAYTSAQDPASPIKVAKSPLAAPVENPDLTIWAQALGAWGRTETDGNAATLTRSLGGLFTGVDQKFGQGIGQVRAGIVAGYTNTDLNVSARASSADIDSAHIGAYAGTSFGALHIRTGAEYAWNGIAENRSISFPGFSDQTNANYHADEGQVFGELGYGLQYGSVAIEPFGGLAFVYLNTSGFTEAGGPSALTGLNGTSEIGYSTLGSRLKTVFVLPNGMALTPWGSAAWEHAIGTVAPTATLAFANTGAAFTTQSAPLARDAALVQIGADLQVSPQASIGIAYSGQLAANANDQSVKGNFTWRF